PASAGGPGRGRPAPVAPGASGPIGNGLVKPLASAPSGCRGELRRVVRRAPASVTGGGARGR
ncbi:hypothetical protein, partial [Mycolicibacterium fallax]|uniref:hypothetical protein n=1 Tax=Mycolicibacterium fallax TaxID=1793 RepID=UPI0021F2EA28